MNKEYNREKQEVVCEGCGKSFKKLVAEVRRRKHHFCSKDCYTKNKREFISEINYKTGVVHTTKNVRIMNKLHKRRDSRGYVGEHILVVEKALGKPLDKTDPIHHVDKNTKNNINSNLVVCEDIKYHSLLHRRLRIREAGGNPNTDKICARCKKVLNHELFYKNKETYDNLEPICKECTKEKNTKGY